MFSLFLVKEKFLEQMYKSGKILFISLPNKLMYILVMGYSENIRKMRSI